MVLMNDLRIVLIGAGSTVFTPGLLADLATSPTFHDATVVLVDIDPVAVDVMSRLGRRIATERGVALRVEGTTDRRAALPGASFVTTTIAVGGAPAWEADVRIGERHGIAQTVGDSVGPGGVFRALRHIPELVAIARDMEELCPDAWLLNYTNPLTANVRGIQAVSDIRCVGLCHGIMGTRHVIAQDLGVPTGEINLVAAGVNHLTWLLGVRHNGQDAYPQLRGIVADELASGTSERIVTATLTQTYGLYPSPGDRHVAEFFPYFLRQDGNQLAYGLQPGLDTTNEILAGKGTLWTRLRAEADGVAELDQSLLDETREGERAVHMMESIALDRDSVELAVNLRNDGLLPGLPAEAVVEVPGLVNGAGITGIAVPRLPAGITAVLAARAAQQQLVVDAALTGDPDVALQALLADPLVTSIEAARAMLAEALDVHVAHLPQFR